ncbi:AraC-like DNA-binding protein [Oxalobacteraceae bacterium GrIS 1.11]
MIATSEGPGASLAYVRTLLDVAGSRGAGVGALLRQAGLSGEIGHAPQSRLPAAAVLRLFECAVAATGDADFGLHMGEAVRPASFNALGYAALSCDTLAEALALIPRFERLVTELGSTSLVHEGDGVTLAWRPQVDAGAALRPLQDAIVCGWLSFGRWITGIDGDLRLARFAHPAPPDCREYHRIFRCPLQFDAPDNALLFRRQLLGWPLLAADRAFHAHQRARAQAMLEQLDAPGDFTRRVAALIMQKLVHGTPTLGQLAQALHVSERTLRRRLQQEGSGFQALLSGLRQQQALVYLQDLQLDVADIALLLGYSGEAAFAHAFKVATGVAPREYRRGL